MDVSVVVKEGLLDDIESRVNNPLSDKTIHFYDESGNDFCDVPFGSLESYATLGSKVIYQFISSDSSLTIRAAVNADGIVKRFSIIGKGSVGTPDISGTVGSFTSSADMKFNKTSWTNGMNIAISNLYLVLN